MNAAWEYGFSVSRQMFKVIALKSLVVTLNICSVRIQYTPSRHLLIPFQQWKRQGNV